MRMFDKLKKKVADMPWWGWAIAGGGSLLLFGGGAVATFEYLGWNESQVRDWIAQALAALQSDGIDVSPLNPDDLVIIAKGESNGDPNAVQGGDVVDVNTASGDLAKGIMQTISATFNSFKSASLPDDVFNPVSNIAASSKYILHRYHSSDNVPGVIAVNSGRKYQGY